MNNERAFAEQLAKEAGAMLMEGWQSFDRLTDKDEGEAVTSLDKQINSFILEQIQEAYPDDSILSEEDDPIEKGSDARLWVVDPIDGTVNMMRGIPFFCVSIGLWNHGRASVGVVYDPIHDELFSAIDGKGAWLNGVPMTVSESPMDSGLVLHGQPYNKEEAEELWEVVEPLRAESLVDRQLGSAALMLCYVACGRAELMAITGTKPWDCAAGVLFVWEAGGRVSDFNGGDWELHTKQVMASNGVVHERALELIDLDD